MSASKRAAGEAQSAPGEVGAATAAVGAWSPGGVDHHDDREAARPTMTAPAGARSTSDSSDALASSAPPADVVQRDLESVRERTDELQRHLASLLRRLRLQRRHSRHAQQRRQSLIAGGGDGRASSSLSTTTHAEGGNASDVDSGSKGNSNDDALDLARTHVAVAYVVNALFFLYLRLQGVDPMAHPVRQGIGRVQSYFMKLRHAESQLRSMRRENDDGGSGDNDDDDDNNNSDDDGDDNDNDNNRAGQRRGVAYTGKVRASCERRGDGGGDGSGDTSTPRGGGGGKDSRGARRAAPGASSESGASRHAPSPNKKSSKRARL